MAPIEETEKIQMQIEDVHGYIKGDYIVLHYKLDNHPIEQCVINPLKISKVSTKFEYSSWEYDEKYLNTAIYLDTDSGGDPYEYVIEPIDEVLELLEQFKNK